MEISGEVRLAWLDLAAFKNQINKEWDAYMVKAKVSREDWGRDPEWLRLTELWKAAREEFRLTLVKLTDADDLLQSGVIFKVLKENQVVHTFNSEEPL